MVDGIKSPYFRLGRVSAYFVKRKRPPPFNVRQNGVKMAVKIFEVIENSHADKAGIKKGFSLVKINGNEIDDVLDYRFYMTDSKLEIVLINLDGNLVIYHVNKKEYDDLGLEFETYLIDSQRFCKNKCIFCFVDQTPKGMRDTLYFKDDDSRMSFLFGNYITLTNLKDKDLEKIIKMKISPINVSVHTTNPELRVKMMKNPKAGTSLSYIKQLTEQGIKVNTQLVLCPNINDGAELQRTLNDLSQMYPNLQSVACVPVGVTKFREGLAELSPYDKQSAREVIGIIDTFSTQMLEKHGERFAFASDEFYLIAEYPIPPFEYYGEFAQIDNGVGLMAQLDYDFQTALKLCNLSSKHRVVSIATGTAAYAFILLLAKRAQEKIQDLTIHVYKIQNNFYGHTITVAGLVTATDLISQLRGKELGEQLLLPDVMLRHEKDRFLDNLTHTHVSEALGVPLVFCQNDGFDLLERIINDKTIYD